MDTKEKNFSFDFPDEEVLNSSKEKEKRKENLYLAMILCNNYKRQIILNVLTSDGFKEIDLNIRATTPTYIFLEGGLKIPVKNIKEVRIS